MYHAHAWYVTCTNAFLSIVTPPGPYQLAAYRGGLIYTLHMQDTGTDWLDTLNSLPTNNNIIIYTTIIGPAAETEYWWSGSPVLSTDISKVTSENQRLDM